MREAIAAQLAAASPDLHRGYRRAAWRELRDSLRDASAGELWRYTADLLFLVERPELREAFFPSGVHTMSVEPARDRDGLEIDRILSVHEGPEAAAALRHWWQVLPQAFAAIRDREGRLAGFSVAFDPQGVREDDLVADPVTRAWVTHLDEFPIPIQQHAIFIRRWLAADEGERPSAVQAAAWLDAKRTYLEMRPNLRRVYITQRDPEPNGEALTQLGFAPLPGFDARLDGHAYVSATLDMGPRSVDGWLDRLVAIDVGASSELLDRGTRELTCGDARTSLTPKEFEVLAFLEDQSDRAVSHAELVSAVWGYDYAGGSNVDAAVVRSLRAKMGHERERLQTVRGVGYRLLVTPS